MVTDVGLLFSNSDLLSFAHKLSLGPEGFLQLPRTVTRGQGSSGCPKCFTEGTFSLCVHVPWLRQNLPSPALRSALLVLKGSRYMYHHSFKNMEEALCHTV